jgi:O-antigen/teichoic acid export membrane protein
VAMSLVAVILVKVSLQHVNTSDYGNIVLILAASNTIQVFLNWSCSAMVRFGVEEFLADKHIIHIFWARTFVFLLNLLLVLALSPLWFGLLQSFLDFDASIKPLILIHIIIGSLWMHGQQALQAVRRPLWQSYLLLGERVLSLVVLVFLIVVHWVSWQKIFWVLAGSSVVMFLVSMFMLKSFLGPVNMKRTKETAGKILLFALPLLPYTITSFFCTNYLNAYFINAYLTKSDVTVFNTVFQVTGLLTQLPILLNMLIMPQFVSMRMEQKEESIKKYMEKIVPVLTVAWSFGVAIVSFLLVWFIPSFFGKDFYAVGPVIILLSAGAIFSFPSLISYSPFILSVSDVKVSFPMALVTAAVNIIAHFILIKPFGLAGSAIATLLSTISGLFYIAVHVERKHKFRSNMVMVSLMPAVLSIVIYLFTQNIVAFITGMFLFSLIFFFLNRNRIVSYLNLALMMIKPTKNG